MPVSLTSPGCRAVSSSSELLIFLPLPTSFLNCCGHCYCPACLSAPQPCCYFLLCSPSSSPHPGSDPEPKSCCSSLISPALAARALTCSLHPDSHHISSRLLCSSLGKARSCLLHIHVFLGTPLATSPSPHIYLSLSLPHQTAATFLHLSRLLLASSQSLFHHLFLTRGPPSSSCARCSGSLLPFYIFQRKPKVFPASCGCSSPLALALCVHMAPKTFLHQEPITAQQPSLASCWSSRHHWTV